MSIRNIFTKVSIAIVHAALITFFASLSTLTVLGCTSTPRIKVYFDPPRSDWSSLPITLCDLNSDFHCADIKLKGYLYLPAGETVASSKKDMPLIIYNHGSGKGVSDVCEVATYFNNHGYLFFVPFRRGHRAPDDDSLPAGRSTGFYFQDYLDKLACPNGICSTTQSHLLTLDYLDQQTFEVRKAMNFMTSLKNSAGERIADPDKVAIMGHSFGGIVTVFNNANMNTPKVFLPSAPASLSWKAYDLEDGVLDDDSPSIQKLKAAALLGHAPAFFFEPTNDASTHPIFVLSGMAAEIGPFPPREYQATLFPAVPLAPGENSEDAHANFVLHQDQVQIWAPAARNFMARYGVK